VAADKSNSTSADRSPASIPIRKSDSNELLCFTRCSRLASEMFFDVSFALLLTKSASRFRFQDVNRAGDLLRISIKMHSTTTSFDAYGLKMSLVVKFFVVPAGGHCCYVAQYFRFSSRFQVQVLLYLCDRLFLQIQTGLADTQLGCADLRTVSSQR